MVIDLTVKNVPSVGKEYTGKQKMMIILFPVKIARNWMS